MVYPPGGNNPDTQFVFTPGVDTDPDLQPQNSGGGDYGYGYGYGGYGGGGSTDPTDDQKTQAGKTLGLDKYAAKAKVRTAKDSLARLKLQQQANNRIAETQLRTAALNFNTDWHAQELKAQIGHNALANSMGNAAFGSTSRNTLANLAGLNRDIYTNEVFKNKRAQYNDIYNNLYSSQIANQVNAQKLLSELRQNLRDQKITTISNLDSIHKDFGDKYFKGDQTNKTVKSTKNTDLKYYDNYMNWIDQREAAYAKNTPVLQSLGLIRPDGKNTANSNPLAPRNQNTNSNNRAGSVANKNTENFFNSLHAGYEGRDKNMSRTQIETGR